ncbi:single-stranded DNA-binding protein [Aureibaculum sp. 2210JD6-5]|uniref:single-stranded DNA-binding protein n=1 Tax=Aureibaculum sp. 2210JD6-5 TaxID=3103957 RepID=UPI002AAEE0DF|nr:single-stranded DNA-binding protein [Aureibaculum sp. 2210JD6-5]MDY7395364.1 single-stranded DNA-binding protein [Aureibaculum sp. 2210JD6-5]
MNKLKNNIQLIGNVGEDPDITNLENERKKARFSLATNELFKNAQGDKVKRTYWHTIVAWGKVAEIIEKYVRKGKEIAIEGKLASRSYKDKEGVKHYVSEVIVSEILLLGNIENNQKIDENAL